MGWGASLRNPHRSVGRLQQVRNERLVIYYSLSLCRDEPSLSSCSSRQRSL